MEVKRFEEYTPQEQKRILMHWFHYYGKDVCFLEEVAQFEELANTESRAIFTIAVMSLIDGKGTKLILQAMRQNRTTELFDTVKRKMEEENFSNMLKGVTEPILAEMIRTLESPEPDIPFDEAVMLEKILGALAFYEGEEKLNPARVNDIFQECLVRSDELCGESPTCEYSIAEGVFETAKFHTGRLNEQKPAINEMLDEIPDIDQGIHFLNLCIAKGNRLWTGDHAVVDRLMVLGFATGLLSVFANIPKSEWNDMFSQGLPFVIKNEEKVDTLVVGNKPDKVQKEYK